MSVTAGISELGGPRGERGDPARPVEDRVLGVDVEMDEGRLGHGGPSYYRRPDTHLAAATLRDVLR